MKSENTNDFSKCSVRDKLWSKELGNCYVCMIDRTGEYIKIQCAVHLDSWITYRAVGGVLDSDPTGEQSLFFSNPNIIAPLEPVRLPDYKPGQWIAVWDNGLPAIRRFMRFEIQCIICCGQDGTGGVSWPNHCTLEELPAVLAKMEEQK